MKKPASRASLLLALSPLTAFAQSTVNIYGRVDLGIDSTKTGSNSVLQQRDNASRLGFRGVEDLGDGMKANFGFEMGVTFDTGVPTTPMFRNSYVGIGGTFGNFAMGRLDSANPTGSPFYSLVTKNVAFTIHDAGATAIGTRVLNARNRTSRSIGYSSSDLGGATFMARYNFNGLDVPLTATGPIKLDSDIRQVDLGVNYQAGALGLGLGFGKDSIAGGLANNGFDKKYMAVASYKLGAVKGYGLYGQDSYKGTAKTRSDVNYWLVGAQYDAGVNEITANYMQRAVQADLTGTLKKFQISYAYKLSRRTQLFALYDRDDPNTNVQNDVIRTVSFGIRHNF